MCKLCTKMARKMKKALNYYQIKFSSFTVKEMRLRNAGSRKWNSEVHGRRF